MSVVHTNNAGLQAAQYSASAPQSARKTNSDFVCWLLIVD